MSDDSTDGQPQDEQPGLENGLENGLEDELAEERAERKKLSALTIALLVIVGLLLIGVIVVLVLFLLRGSGQPSPVLSSNAPSGIISPSPVITPIETPTPAPSESEDDDAPPPAPPPPPSGPDGTIASFAAPSTPGCLSPEAPAYQDSITITFTWSTQNVSQVALGVGPGDAINAPYQTGLPPSGSLDLSYPCSNSSQVYTLTVAGSDGVHVSKSVTVSNPSASS